MHESPNSIWHSERFLVAVVMFLCYVNFSMQINNMNIAVVEMTSNKTITIAGNLTEVRMAEFQWDTITIGTVSCILWYGGLFVFTAGFFVDKFGGSGTCVISMMMCGVLTILHPIILKFDYFGFLMCRFITGFFLNLFCASTSEVYSRWFPKKERTTLIAIGCDGANVGTTIAFPLFGFIAAEWGWQMVFYVSGIISIFISLLCFTIVRDRPSQDGWISEAELSYILDETDNASRNKMSHPYKKILCSGPLYAVCFGKFTLEWLTTILTACLPLYVKDFTGGNTDEIGLLSSIPTVAQIFMFPIAGLLLDRWKNTTFIQLTLMHKITVGIAYLVSSLLFAIVVLSSDFTTSMIVFVLIQIITSDVPVVIEPIVVCLSPNDSSVVSGLSKFLGCIAKIVSRTCVGFLTLNHSTQEWNNCFLLTTGILIIGTVVFILFGSSEAQAWSSSDQERERLVKIISTQLLSL